MKQVFGNISPLVDSQFPAFYREEGPLFVSFVKKYYEWLEANNNALYYSRNMLSIADIDTTLDDFLPHFQEKYLNGISINATANKRDVIKHARDIYKTKGTIQSLRMVFRLLFNEEINVYYPGDDILRTSDAKWIRPIYLELSISERNIGFIGKTVTGSISAASAFVEDVVRRTHMGKVVDVAYLSNVTGNFQTGELVSDDGVISKAPKIIGSLTSVDVTVAGSGFEVGQVLDVISDRTGRIGKVRVTNAGVRTGEVNYILVGGGFGYTQNANVFGSSQKVYVSANVLSLTSFTSSNTSITSFSEFETIKQPLVNVAFGSANTTFVNGSLVYGVNATSNAIAAGRILASNQSGTSGWLLISPRAVETININTVTGANTLSGSFIPGEVVYQVGTAGNTVVGDIIYANSTTAVVSKRYGDFANGVLTIGGNSHCTANTTSVLNVGYTNSNFSNASVVKLIANLTSNGATKTTATDISATANVVGANGQAVGIFTPTNTFVDTLHNYVYSPTTNAYAAITVISSGNPGSFKVGGIGNTEIVYLNTDIIGGNNSGNVAFLSVRLNANNSNATSNTGFGFPHLPSANLTAVIGTALAKNAFTIGTIISLTDRNPGNNNTAKPFHVELEKIIASYGKKERISMILQNTSGFFRPDEMVTQTFVDPAISVAVSGVTGTYDTVGREVLKQVRSDGVTVYGEVYSAAVVAGNGTLRIRVANTANTFNTSNTIVGTYSTATATPGSVTANNLTTKARGTIISSNTTAATVRRTSFINFVTGTPMVGADSGTTTDVMFITDDESSLVLGHNAVVNAAAGISDGTIEYVDVIDSGFSYQEGETVTLYASNNQIVAKGTVLLGTQGKAEGYWITQNSFLDSNKYIQDNNYYQEYSYEIQSGINQNNYNDFIENTVHVAGTKRFGSFKKEIHGAVVASRTQATYPLITTLTVGTVTGTFTAGELVNQTNGITNTANGYVLSYDSGLNTLQLINTVGTFITANNVIGANSAATGNITNINIQIS